MYDEIGQEFNFGDHKSSHSGSLGAKPHCWLVPPIDLAVTIFMSFVPAIPDAIILLA